MEGVHHPQPEGDRNEISSHDEPIVYDHATENDPPLAFAEAERHNAYALLAELHDHALTVDAEGERRSDPRHHLAELALSSAVVTWWSRWQPIMMNRALLTGASLSEVAAAAGVTEAEVYSRWSSWAEGQSRSRSGDHPGLDPAEVAAVRGHIRRTAGDNVLGLLGYLAG